MIRKYLLNKIMNKSEYTNYIIDMNIKVITVYIDEGSLREINFLDRFNKLYKKVKWLGYKARYMVRK